jgi:hypothetical protein
MGGDEDITLVSICAVRSIDDRKQLGTPFISSPVSMNYVISCNVSILRSASNAHKKVKLLPKALYLPSNGDS